MTNIAVIGAGVIGISTACAIQKGVKGAHITLFADQFSPNNTSDGAAGLITPSAGKTPRRRKWTKATLDYLADLAIHDPEASNFGVSLTHGYFYYTEKKPVPEWAEDAMNFKNLSDEELKHRFPSHVKTVFSLTTAICRCVDYIPYLTKSFTKNGGKVIKRKIYDFRELRNEFDIVVNCTGLRAKQLCNDPEIYPIRGQILKVKAPWHHEFLLCLDPIGADNKDTYVFPRSDCVVLGGIRKSNDYDTSVRDSDREWILKTTTKFFPSLKNAEILGDWVGLRPARTQVRLEKQIIHN